MIDPQPSAAAGLLLVTGAAVFWSVILVAVAETVRTGSLPFKDSATVPALEFYQSIGAKPRWWVAINVVFTAGILITALGLAVLAELLAGAGDVVYAVMGLVLFLIAAGLWAVQTALNLSVTRWIAGEVGRSGVMPGHAEVWPLLSERMIHLYMVLAYLATSLYGAAMLSTGLLEPWAGWLAVVAGVAGAASVILTGPKLAIPLLIHVVPAVLGVLLLRLP